MFLFHHFRIRSAILSPLVEKCVGSTRSGTKQKALDVLMGIIDADTPAPIVEELVNVGIKLKQPKSVAACVAALKEIVRLYGCKTVDIKPIMKSLVMLFGHADAAVRSEVRLSMFTDSVGKHTGRGNVQVGRSRSI